VRGSVTDPRTGPTGYANWTYVGAVRNDAGSNLLAFYHWGDRFDLMDQVVVAIDASPTVGSNVVTALASFVPVSASHALYWLKCYVAGVWGTVHYYLDGFTASDWWGWPTGTWTTAGNRNFVPNYYPTPTIPKSVTHKLTNDGGACAFSAAERDVSGWLDGFLRETAQ